MGFESLVAFRSMADRSFSYILPSWGAAPVHGLGAVSFAPNWTWVLLAVPGVVGAMVTLRDSIRTVVPHSCRGGAGYQLCATFLNEADRV